MTFTKQTLAFLDELYANNDRSWFEANRERYEAYVREPALSLVRAVGQRLPEISRHLVADDRKLGGSLMRIHRDTRFSQDKSPYKTNIGIQFRHAAGKDVHAPGLYVHVDPTSCFFGAGVYHPEAKALAAIREAVASGGKRFLKIVVDAGIAKWKQEGDSLKRPPKGFEADHPQIEELKRKDFILVYRTTHREIVSKRLVDTLLARFHETRAYMAFLCKALDLPF